MSESSVLESFDPSNTGHPTLKMKHCNALSQNHKLRRQHLVKRLFQIKPFDFDPRPRLHCIQYKNQIESKNPLDIRQPIKDDQYKYQKDAHVFDTLELLPDL